MKNLLFILLMLSSFGMNAQDVVEKKNPVKLSIGLKMFNVPFELFSFEGFQGRIQGGTSVRKYAKSNWSEPFGLNVIPSVRMTYGSDLVRFHASIGLNMEMGFEVGKSFYGGLTVGRTFYIREKLTEFGTRNFYSGLNLGYRLKIKDRITVSLNTQFNFMIDSNIHDRERESLRVSRYDRFELYYFMWFPLQLSILVDLNLKK